MTTTILLLSGWAGSGKDAAAALLVEEMGFERLAFADGLKEDVSRLHGIPLHVFHDRCAKDKTLSESTKKTPRGLLLEHALMIRATNPDTYSQRIATQIISGPGRRYVISDWRYKREYEHLHTCLGSTARLLRARIQRAGITPTDDPSEHDLKGESFDFVIQNDGCISDLRDGLKTLLRQTL
jgi:hypothetical protein